MGGRSPWTPDLALVGVEIVIVFGLAEGDAADSSAVVPGGPVVITEEAEDPVALQRPVSTHDEPALPRLPLFLQEEEVGVAVALLWRSGRELAAPRARALEPSVPHRHCPN